MKTTPSRRGAACVAAVAALALLLVLPGTCSAARVLQQADRPGRPGAAGGPGLVTPGPAQGQGQGIGQGQGQGVGPRPEVPRSPGPVPAELLPIYGVYGRPVVVPGYGVAGSGRPLRSARAPAYGGYGPTRHACGHIGASASQPSSLSSSSRQLAGHRRAPVAPQALISYVEVAPGDHPDDLAVEVYPTEAAVGSRMCEIVLQAATQAVRERGVFFLAIPGGSVLKMCAGLVGKAIPWDKTVLFYVNHKCVPAGDKAATHTKALDIFLAKVGMPLANVATLQGTGNAEAEAAAYDAKLRELAVQRGMALTMDVVPRFDLMLLGMGADGHVGSLYPGRKETTMAAPGTPLVLPVDKKQPPSITLSLPVMRAARQVVVCMTGASKADAVRIALQDSDGGAADLPGRLVRPVEAGSAIWLMDGPAASKLDISRGARSILAADEAARSMVVSDEW